MCRSKIISVRAGRKSRSQDGEAFIDRKEREGETCRTKAIGNSRCRAKSSAARQFSKAVRNTAWSDQSGPVPPSCKSTRTRVGTSRLGLNSTIRDTEPIFSLPIHRRARNRPRRRGFQNARYIPAPFRADNLVRIDSDANGDGLRIALDVGDDLHIIEIGENETASAFH